MKTLSVRLDLITGHQFNPKPTIAKQEDYTFHLYTATLLRTQRGDSTWRIQLLPVSVQETSSQKCTIRAVPLRTCSACNLRVECVCIKRLRYRIVKLTSY